MSDIRNFMSSKYSINVGNPPTTAYISHDLDINVSININIIDAYNGCVKEKVIQRNQFNIGDNGRMEKRGHIDDNKVENICIEIPQGVLNNETITIPNKGHILCNNYKNSTGNININVIINDKLYLYEVFEFFNIDIKTNITKYNIYETDYYIKQENDIILYKTITLKEALCGYKCIIPHIDGKLYEIISKQNTIISPNYKTTLVSAGFNRNNKLGNLIINYNILFPTKLTPSQLTHIKNLL